MIGPESTVTVDNSAFIHTFIHSFIHSMSLVDISKPGFPVLITGHKLFVLSTVCTRNISGYFKHKNAVV